MPTSQLNMFPAYWWPLKLRMRMREWFHGSLFSNAEVIFSCFPCEILSRFLHNDMHITNTVLADDCFVDNTGAQISYMWSKKTSCLDLSILAAEKCSSRRCLWYRRAKTVTSIAWSLLLVACCQLHNWFWRQNQGVKIRFLLISLLEKHWLISDLASLKVSTFS